MNKNDLFTEMTPEELQSYCDSQFSEMEEYEKLKFSDALIKEIKSISSDLKKASGISGRIEKELRMYGNIASDKLTLELLNIIKNAWGKCASLKNKTDVRINQGFLFKESDFLMKSSDIKIEKNNTGYHIILPILIPHKKMAPFIANYAESYRMPIYNALSKRFPDKRPLFLEKCDISIIHHFKTESELIDYDNFDYTHLLNCLASFFLTDDSPKYYKLSIDGTVDGNNFSEIYLTRE